MRISASACVLAAALMLASAIPSLAQRVAFERSYNVGAAPTLDVSTIRGQIDVSAGDADRIVVKGTATVRYGLSVPTTAYELVKRVAANPPIQQDGNTIRLRPPSDADEQRCDDRCVRGARAAWDRREDRQRLGCHDRDRRGWSRLGPDTIGRHRCPRSRW